jgi:hypothetical protein
MIASGIAVAVVAAVNNLGSAVKSSYTSVSVAAMVRKCPQPCCSHSGLVPSRQQRCLLFTQSKDA